MIRIFKIKMSGGFIKMRNFIEALNETLVKVDQLKKEVNEMFER